jgi:hypothetical protein
LFIFFLAKTANTSLAWKLTQISVPDHLRSLLTDLDRQCPLRAAVQHRQAAMCHDRTFAVTASTLRRGSKAVIHAVNVSCPDGDEPQCGSVA